MWFCPRDALADYLYCTYGASLLMEPTEAVAPGRLLYNERTLRSPGVLDDLVAGPPLRMRDVTEAFDAADISSKRSGELSGEVALNILQGVLDALGLDVPVDAKVSLTRKTSSVYSFNHVRYCRLRPAALSGALQNRPLDRKLSEVQELIAGGTFCMVDSIFTSRDLNMSVTTSDSASLAASAKALFGSLGEAKVSFAKKSETELAVTFKGTKDLTFAYSVVPVRIDDRGRLNFRPEAFNLDEYGSGVFLGVTRELHSTDSAEVYHVVPGNQLAVLEPGD